MPAEQKIRTLDATMFTREVLGGTGPFLVIFSARWCGPCKQLEPVIMKILERAEGRFDAIKIDTDQSPSLTTKFKVQALPTMLVVHHGKEVWRHCGFMTESNLAKELDAIWRKV